MIWRRENLEAEAPIGKLFVIEPPEKRRVNVGKEKG